MPGLRAEEGVRVNCVRSGGEGLAVGLKDGEMDSKGASGAQRPYDGREHGELRNEKEGQL